MYRTISLFNAAVFMAGSAAASDDVCRALVLSGGGNNGSWEVGVLYGLVNNGTASDYAYDVVTGVSAGSINTIAMAGWEVGNEKAMADWLSDLALERSESSTIYLGGTLGLLGMLYLNEVTSITFAAEGEGLI